MLERSTLQYFIQYLILVFFLSSASALCTIKGKFIGRPLIVACGAVTRLTSVVDPLAVGLWEQTGYQTCLWCLFLVCWSPLLWPLPGVSGAERSSVAAADLRPAEMLKTFFITDKLPNKRISDCSEHTHLLVSSNHTCPLWIELLHQASVSLSVLGAPGHLQLQISGSLLESLQLCHLCLCAALLLGYFGLGLLQLRTQLKSKSRNIRFLSINTSPV